MSRFKKSSKHHLPKTLAITLGVVLFVIIIAYQKISYLSADPKGAKDCFPVSPDSLSDPSKKTNLSIEIPEIKLPWLQKGGEINDASCLDRTSVHGIVQVASEEDIKQALDYARQNGLKVSAAGVKHSMGGQAFFKNALVLDMTKFNKVILNDQAKTITVQSGATWHDIQNIIHPKYAVKAMQSTDIFTVGGSISVNAHGMDHNVGSVAKTIKSMHVMTSDGSVLRLSREDYPELFNLVIGGYGLFGIILDADIEITDNQVYDYEHELIKSQDFLDVFKNDISKGDEYGLFYGHLSTAPSSFLDQMIIYKYKKTNRIADDSFKLTEVSSVKLRRFVLNLSKKGSILREIKWFAEKYIEPKLECPTPNRNQAMKDGEGCLVSRNEPMHDSVPYLRNDLKNDTDILHEYFIPRQKYPEFIDGMRKILTENNTNLLNASVRVVHQEDNFLNYAPQDAFSIVLYINQTTDAEGNKKMSKVTSELIDLTNNVGGKFFLPYQLYYSFDQLKQSYPEIEKFFALKKRFDPEELFTNTWYEKYSKG